MIVLDLCCENEHTFEGWFGSANAFETQLAQGLVTCPVCASAKIVRKLSAPYVNTRSSALVPAKQTSVAEPALSSPTLLPTAEPSLAAVEAVIKVLRKMASVSEDVGQRFPEEARRIHYGEAEERNIKGQASADDVLELIDEGIMVVPMPPDESDMH